MRKCLDDGNLQFEPVGNYDTKNIQCELKGNELAARRVSSSLSSPNRCNGIQNASSDTIQYSSCHLSSTRVQSSHSTWKLTTKHPVCILRRRLQGSRENAPQACQSNCCNTSIFITHPTADEATDKSSGKIIYSNLYDHTVINCHITTQRGRHLRCLPEAMVYQQRQAVCLHPNDQTPSIRHNFVSC